MADPDQCVLMPWERPEHPLWSPTGDQIMQRLCSETSSEEFHRGLEHAEALF